MPLPLTRVQETYAAVKSQWEQPPRPDQVPDPADVIKRGSEAEQQLFYTASKHRNRKGFLVRSALAQRLAVECAIGKKLRRAPYDEVMLPDMSRKAGLSICRPERFPSLDRAIGEAREAFKAYQPGTTKREKDSLEGVTRPNKAYDSAINKLAAHPQVLRVAADYLGFLPILYRINLLYSPNDDVYAKSSQFFHLDPGDVSQVKIFVWVEDVDGDTGPLSGLPADRSEFVRRAVNYRLERLPDETLDNLGQRNHVVEFTGKAGTMIFVDTNRCFHMGSRMGSKPRYAIMIQYISPYHEIFPIDGELPPPMIGVAAIPPRMTMMEEYLYGRRR